MHFNHPFSLGLFATILSLAAACGNSGGGESVRIQGPRIEGSTHVGMVFAAVSVDQSLKSSRVYRYEFATGLVVELLPGESGNPGVFAFGDKVLLFNRQAGSDKTVRLVDPKGDDSAPKAALVQPIANLISK